MSEFPLFGAYEKRIIVLLENDDYSGFNQVLLNAEQLKKVSDAIILSTRKDSSLKEGYDLVEVNLDDDRTIASDVFEGMNSVNV